MRRSLRANIMAGNHVTINIEELAREMDSMMSQNSLRSSKCCIFKIPKILSRHDEKAYTPNGFSIGPFHHGQPHLEAGEKIKLQYLKSLIARRPTTETSLKNFIEEIRNLEGEARECYAEPIDFDVNKFVMILVLDGCFIIELLRKISDDVMPKDADDPVLDTSCIRQFVYHDLILLENQIPWLVLERLFRMTTVRDSKYSLAELVIRFLGFNFSRNILPIDNTNHRSKHMLDLLRNSLASSSGLKEGGYHEGWRLIPSATSLVEAGIKFKKGTSNSLLNIKFSNGVLEIPPLVIQETTNVAFRNLISFEQCYPKCTAKITCYTILLDNLINDTKDMDILRKHGIIDNWLNPGEAIQLFNELYNDTCVNQFYYLDLCRKVNEYCQHKWPRWRAMYVRNHFSSPWAIFSQVFGSLILLLTFLQTFYTIKNRAGPVLLQGEATA